MKVSVFFDGQNFYRSLQRYDESLRVDYDRLATWITQAVGGPSAIFAGADVFVRAGEGVTARGKKVGVAPGWADALSKARRGRCLGQIHLREGIATSRVERPRPLERVPPRMAPSRRARPPFQPASGPALERALQELQRAEARLPHVSRGYFVMRWKSHQLPPVGAEREALVQQLIGAGLAEEFEVKDAEGRNVTAIRSREPDGNIREPDGNIALPG